jgi:hypothetical protein
MATLISIGIGQTSTISTSGSYVVDALADGTLDVSGAGVVANLGSISLVADDVINVSNGATAVISSVVGVGLADQYNIGNGGALELGAGLTVNLGSAINFNNTAGTSATLTLDQGLNLNLLSNGINALTAGDNIVFQGQSITSVNWVQNTGLGDTQGGQLQVTLSGGGTDDIAVKTGTYTTSEFSKSGTSGISFACFVTGTGIDRADGGTTAVENLRIGDEVKLASGGAGRVKWIGWRTLNVERHSEPTMVRPIRIAAGAISDGVPRRDVLMSPDHALYLEGGLTPVRLLVNGATIRPVWGTRAVTYYHVELESHDILLVDGLPAESYLDTGNRSAFENAGGAMQIHPDFEGGLDGQAQREARSCAPFVADSQRVEWLWRGLANRAEALGHELKAPKRDYEPACHLVVDGVCVKHASRRGDRYTFIVPAGGGDVRLVSQACIPSDLEPWREDRRRLGVMVASVAFIQGRDVEMIPADHPRLTDGWWDAETDGVSHWRWTDGSAALGTVEGRSRIDIVMNPLACGYPSAPEMERVAVAA